MSKRLGAEDLWPRSWQPADPDLSAQCLACRHQNEAHAFAMPRCCSSDATRPDTPWPRCAPSAALGPWSGSVRDDELLPEHDVLGGQVRAADEERPHEAPDRSQVSHRRASVLSYEARILRPQAATGKNRKSRRTNADGVFGRDSHDSRHSPGIPTPSEQRRQQLKSPGGLPILTTWTSRVGIAI